MADERAQVLSSLLLEEWDVLGVADIDVTPESEYLHEASEILERLLHGVSEHEVADYLEQRSAELASHHDRSRDRRAAVAVVKWWSDSL